MQQILLVEDDTHLAEWVKEFLQKANFSVQVLHDGDQVVDFVRQSPPDLILLDWMLPGKDGLQLCRLLREFYHQPIIMLTAKDDEMDEVLGLELGADDYLIKPVRPRVLLTRMQKLLNLAESKATKTNDIESDKLVFADLTLNLAANRLTFGEDEIELSTTEFKVFSYLAQHAGQTLSRDDLFKALKGREYDGFDRSLDVVISALRKKLEIDPSKPQRIKSIWGKGYLFVPDAWTA